MDDQIDSVERIVATEQADLADEGKRTREQMERNRIRIGELEQKLAQLKSTKREEPEDRSGIVRGDDGDIEVEY